MKHTINPTEHIDSSGMTTTCKTVPWQKGIQALGKLTTLILLTLLFTTSTNAQDDYSGRDFIMADITNAEADLLTTSPADDSRSFRPRWVFNEDNGEWENLLNQMGDPRTPRIITCDEDFDEYTDDGGRSWNYDEDAPTYAWILCSDDPCLDIKLEFTRFSVSDGDMFRVFHGAGFDADGPTGEEYVGSPFTGKVIRDINGGWVKSDCEKQDEDDGIDGNCLTITFNPDGDDPKGEGWVFKAVCEDIDFGIECPEDDAISGQCRDVEINGDDVECLVGKYKILPPAISKDCGNLRTVALIDLGDGGISAFLDEDLTMPATLIDPIPDAGINIYLKITEDDFKCSGDTITIGYDVVCGDEDASDDIDDYDCQQELALLPPAIVCNDDLTVGVPYSCNGSLVPDDVLENPCSFIDYEMTLYFNGVEVDKGETVSFEGGCSGAYTVKVEDECGNSCKADFTVSDDFAPKFDVPEQEKVWCGEDFAQENAPTATDNCGAATTPKIISESFTEDKCGQFMFDPVIPRFIPAPGVDEDDIEDCVYWEDEDETATFNVLEESVLEVFGILINNDIRFGAKTIVYESEDECGNVATEPVTLFQKRPAISRFRIPTKTEINGCIDAPVPSPDDIMDTDGFGLTDAMPYFWDGDEDGSLQAIQAEIIGAPFDEDLLGNPRKLDHSCSVSVTFKDSDKIPLPDNCGYKVFRSWTLYDWCFNFFYNDLALPILTFPMTTFTQVIIVTDDEAPEFTDLPLQDIEKGTNPLTCETNMIIPVPSLDDNCDLNPSARWEIKNSDGNVVDSGDGPITVALEPGTYTIEWTAFDECGNESEVEIQNLVVVDDDEPICYADRFTVVPLDDNDGGSVIVCADNLDSNSKDNCGVPELRIKKMTDSAAVPFSKCVTLTCDDLVEGCDGGVMIRFRAYDDILSTATTVPDMTFNLPTGGAARFSECMVEVALQDKKPPSIVCGPPKTFNCEDIDPENIDALFTAPIATDNCDSDPEVILIRQEGGLNDCGIGTITRIWRAEDICGNKSTTCSQTVTVTSGTDYKVTFPADITVNVTSCDDPSLDPIPVDEGGAGYPEVEGAVEPCQNILINDIKSDGFEARYLDEDGFCTKITRTWCVMDWCVYDPQLDDYITDPQVGVRMFNDGGDGIICYTQTIKIKRPDNPPVLCSEEIVFKDLLEPAISGGIELTNQFATFTPGDLITNGDDLISAGAVLTIDYQPDFINVPSLKLSCMDKDQDINVTIRALFPDGSEETCDAVIGVNDTATPVIACVQELEIPVADGETVVITPEMLYNSVVDNCDDSAFLISTLNIEDPSENNEDPLGAPFGRNGMTERELTFDLDIMDKTGNSGECEARITLVQPTSKASIAGSIHNEKGESIDEVTVDVNNGLMPSMKTTDDGLFHFDGLEMHGNYTITPEKDLDPLNGVNTFDLVLISQHILGTQELDSPYKLIAADVNKSGNITGNDVIAIRQLILNKIDAFPNNSSWRFVDGEYQFDNPSNPWSSPFPEVFNLVDLSEDKMDMDFMAIKVGDVDGDAFPTRTAFAQGRSSNGLLSLVTEARAVRKGEEVKIAFTANDFRAVQGLQFAMTFDESVLEFTEVKANALPNLSDANFGYTLLDNGVITASWNEVEGKAISMDNDDVLFEMNFTAKADGQLSELIGLNPGYLRAEAYVEGEGTYDLSLQFGADASTVDQFELFQNKPNPFNGETQVGFNLPEAGQATLTIYDVSGRILRQLTGEYIKGYNEVRISRADLDATGVLYYRLDSASNSATRKMVILK